MGITCFLVSPTQESARYLRRYARYDETRKCTTGYGCDCWVRIEDGPKSESGDNWPHDDARWPKECWRCGRPFESGDEWQLFEDRIYAADDGRQWPLRDLPPGAMFYPSWLQPVEGVSNEKGYVCPTNGSVLTVITPDKPDGSGTHQWIVDAYCSNCDRKGDIHHCWCRHGIAPNITVNKVAPDALGTCGAGAGSILAPGGYHAMLTNGVLCSC